MVERAPRWGRRLLPLVFAVVMVALPRPCRAESDGVRIAAEAGGGLAGGAVGGLAGLLVGAATCTGGLECIGHAMVGGAAGAAVGVGAGTYFGGRIADGNGGVGQTYLGELVGILTLAILVGVAVELDLEPPGALAVPLVIGLPIAGAVVGYELSHDDDESQPAAGSAPLMVSIPILF